MASRTIPAQTVLRQLLRYEPETGRLFWRERGVEWFRHGEHSAEHTAAKWNARFAGKEALTATVTGYKFGNLFGVKLLAHRVIWKWVHGTDPDQIDHINGNRADNRLENLRSVDATTNQRNTKRPVHNTSGRIGVSYDRHRDKWAAYITLGSRKTKLGRFSTFEAACAARDAAEREHGFHENHGR
jgi:hypothetical protein